MQTEISWLELHYATEIKDTQIPEVDNDKAFAFMFIKYWPQVRRRFASTHLHSSPRMTQQAPPGIWLVTWQKKKEHGKACASL